MSIRPDDPRLADFTPEEIARGLPAQIAQQNDTGVDIFKQKEDKEDQTRVEETDDEKADRLRREAESRLLAQQQSDAFSRLRTLLARVGLQEMEGAVRDVITSGKVDINDADAIMFSLRDQPVYKRRFAANDARLKAGLPELDPATYIALEQQYKQVMQANGIDAQFYNDQSDYEAWIAGDVSPAELQDRVENGFKRVRDADPEVRRQMQQLYNVSDADLAAYFLDPKRAQPLLTARQKIQQAKAAGIAARGLEQGGMQLTSQEAEALAERGFTSDEAATAFAQRRQLAGLYETMAGEEAMSREQEIGTLFGYDTAATENLRERQRKRLAAFQGGGGFSRTSGRTSGTLETGLGSAQ